VNQALFIACSPSRMVSVGVIRLRCGVPAAVDDAGRLLRHGAEPADHAGIVMTDQVKRERQSLLPEGRAGRRVCQTWPVTDAAAASTHAIAGGELPGPVRQALADLADRHGIADLVPDATMVVRTVSPAVRRRRWGRAARAESYAMLSGALLVVMTTSDGVTVTAWRLAEAEVRRLTERIGGVVATGLQVTAFRLGGGERQAIFVALAADQDGSAFEAAVRDITSS
jgi:hypothetical protein